MSEGGRRKGERDREERKEGERVSRVEQGDKRWSVV